MLLYLLGSCQTKTYQWVYCEKGGWFSNGGEDEGWKDDIKKMITKDEKQTISRWEEVWLSDYV